MAHFIASFCPTQILLTSITGCDKPCKPGLIGISGKDLSTACINKKPLLKAFNAPNTCYIHTSKSSLRIRRRLRFIRQLLLWKTCYFLLSQKPTYKKKEGQRRVKEGQLAENVIKLSATFCNTKSARIILFIST